MRTCSRKNPPLHPAQPALAAKVGFGLINAQMRPESAKGLRVIGNGVNNIKVSVLSHNLLYNRQLTWSF